MKKVSTIALILALLMTLGSCGGEKENEKNNETEKPVETGIVTDTKEVTDPAEDEESGSTAEPEAEPSATIDFATVTVSSFAYGSFGEEITAGIEGAESFTSSKPSVATVKADGTITCNSEGVALIGYEKDGEQMAFALCVFGEGDGPDRTSGESGQLFEVGATFVHTAPVGGVVYSSSNESVVDVSAAPTLCFKKSGYACVTCASASRPFSYSFVVYDRVVEK